MLYDFEWKKNTLFLTLFWRIFQKHCNYLIINNLWEQQILHFFQFFASFSPFFKKLKFCPFFIVKTLTINMLRVFWILFFTRFCSCFCPFFFAFLHLFCRCRRCGKIKIKIKELVIKHRKIDFSALNYK